ncbi:MAG: hypothetical protein L0287_02865, partial [Anaerolineae bacterium]|nr:hypothetical protein [Anaerolineae bacterium]
IARRVGVLGIGMGAIAASQAFHSVDEVKCLVLDSIYDNIPRKYTEDIVVEWPFLAFSRPVLSQGLALNMRVFLRVPSTNLDLPAGMSKLYPKALVFVEKAPLNERVRILYEAAKEPKELLQLQETASNELIGEAREKYCSQVEIKIKEYLPPVSSDKTMDLTK